MNDLKEKLGSKIERSKDNVSNVPEIAITIDEALIRKNKLNDFVAKMMVSGVDYGLIPNCPKPSLFKPGAEKLCDAFGFSKHVEVTNRVEDAAGMYFSFEVKVILISKETGLIEAEGLGSCNSKEKSYAKRSPFEIANTLLKMAKKRALIDAVLSATRSSDLFTQDIEDLELPKVVETDLPASKAQLSEIYNLVANLKLPYDEVKNLLYSKYKITASKYLTNAQAKDFKAYLSQSKAV